MKYATNDYDFRSSGDDCSSSDSEPGHTNNITITPETKNNSHTTTHQNNPTRPKSWTDVRPPRRPDIRPAGVGNVTKLMSPYIVSSSNCGGSSNDDVLEDAVDAHLELKDAALSCVRNREALMERIKKTMPGRRPGDLSSSERKRMERLIRGLRDSSLCVVEAIAEWKRGSRWSDGPCRGRGGGDVVVSSSSSQLCFRWNGANYLLKMLANDAAFVEEIPAAMEILGEGFSAYRNPFLLPFNIDEILGRKPAIDAAGRGSIIKSSRKMRALLSGIVDFDRVKEACMSLLCEEYRAELPLLAATTGGGGRRCGAGRDDVFESSSPAGPKKFDYSNDGTDTEDADWFPRSAFNRFPAPAVDRKELERLSAVPQPPMQAAAVISCARLLVGCDGNEKLMRRNIVPALTPKRSLIMLRRPVKQMIDGLVRFDVDDAELPETLIRVLYPVVNHGEFDPDLIRRTVSNSIGDLAEWIRDVVLDQVEGTDLLERSRGFMLSVPPIFAESTATNNSSLGCIEEESEELHEHQDNDKDTEKVKKRKKKVKKVKVRKKRLRKRKKRNRRHHGWNVSSIKNKENISKDVSYDSDPNSESASWNILSPNNGHNINNAPSNSSMIRFDKWSRSLSGKLFVENSDGTTTEPKIAMVPVPVPCSVSVTEGSATVTLCRGSWKGFLEGSDTLRLSDANASPDWLISPDVSSPLPETEITLSKPYHHSQEKKASIMTPSSPTSPKKHLDWCNDRINRANDEIVKSRPTSVSKKYTDIRIWKLIPESDDNRHPWRREYDDGNVPWTAEYDEYSGYAEHFHVRIKWQQVEEHCEDDVTRARPEECVHEQRVNYFQKVPLSDIIQETFRCVCQWNPVSSGVDSSKWSRLARKFRYLSNLKNANHEVDMAFVRRSRNVQRKLDAETFALMLEDVARMQYPDRAAADDDDAPERAQHTALAELLWSSVVMLPSVNETLWDAAKRMTVLAQAKRLCAQIRLASCHRRTYRTFAYRRQRRAVTCLSKYVRCWIATARRMALLETLHEDRTFRRRHVAAVVCQKYFRRYRWQLFRRRYADQIWKDELETLADYRRRMRRQKEMRQFSVVFREIRRIQRTMTLVRMYLREKRPLTRDYSLEIQAYVPQTQETFTFVLQESVLRDCTERALKSDGSLSWSEMLNTEALRTLADRLMVRVVNRRPIILFSRRSINERGLLIAKKSARVSDRIFVVFLYRSPFDIVVSTYHPPTCQQLRTALSMSKLTDWVRDYEDRKKREAIRSLKTALRKDNSMRCNSSITESDTLEDDYGKNKEDDTPQLLKSEREKDLVNWLLKRLLIKEDPSTGDIMIQLECEAEDEKQEFIAGKIQSVWRKLMTIRHVRKKVREDYEKAYDRERGMYYYTNIKTGMQQYEKPAVLGSEDLADPKDEWRLIQNSSNGRCIYFNPATGQTSWMSEENAAKLLQRKFRDRETTSLLNSKMNLLQLAKALKFVNDTEINYRRQPTKLSNRFNYAMLRHCINCDYESARPHYKEAFSQHPNHPVIARAYAIFILAACDPPRQKNFDRARGLFVEAEGVDPSCEKFRTARESFFRWGVVTNPNHPLALLNYALLHQCVSKDYDRAEKLYRRALAVDPTNANVLENYRAFEEQRFPGGLYAGTGPSLSVLRRSETVEERSEWCGWVLRRLLGASSDKTREEVDDDGSSSSTVVTSATSRNDNNIVPNPPFKTFWYDKVNKVTRFEEPDWKEAWKIRVQRSRCVDNSYDDQKNNNAGVWCEYWDDALQSGFFFNKVTKEYVPA